MEPEQALREVETVIQPKVIQLFGEGGAPMPVQSNVDGAKFAAFIDAAECRGQGSRGDDEPRVCGLYTGCVSELEVER